MVAELAKANFAALQQRPLRFACAMVEREKEEFRALRPIGEKIML